MYLLPPDGMGPEVIEHLQHLIADELNIKEIVLVEDESELSDVSYKPNFKTLGPRFGKQMKDVATRIGRLTSEEITQLRSGQEIELDGGAIGINDLLVQRTERDDLVVAIENNLGVGLDVNLDRDLVAEGVAREVVNRVQNMRKEVGLEVSDRIRLGITGVSELETAVEAFKAYVSGETLAEDLTIGSFPEACVGTQDLEINGLAGSVGLSKK